MSVVLTAITQEKVFFISFITFITCQFLLKIQNFEKIQLFINCALELAAIRLACLYFFSNCSLAIL